MRSHTWETFLKISPNTQDRAPDADALFLASRSIEPEAPFVLRLLREHVLPFVRRQSRLEWFSFLVHDRASGVPTTEDDKAAYVHLRLRFKRACNLRMRAPWVLTQPFEFSKEIAGYDRKTLRGSKVDGVWELLGKQSAMMLDIIEMHRVDVDGFVLLKQMRQSLHFFANMAQMRIS